MQRLKEFFMWLYKYVAKNLWFLMINSFLIFLLIFTFANIIDKHYKEAKKEIAKKYKKGSKYER